MHRRRFIAVALAAWGSPAAAQQPRAQTGAQHEEMLGQDFDALPPGARDRVRNSFRQGSPDVDDAAIRQRWDAMTPDQRGQTLTARERAQQRSPGPGRAPGGGPGGPGGRGPASGPGPSPGPRPGPGRGSPAR